MKNNKETKNRNHRQAANWKYPLKVQVGECTIQCNDAKECTLLVEAAKELVRTTPTTVKSESHMIRTGTVEQAQQATSVTKKLSIQEPTSMNIFGCHVKSSAMRNVVLTGITIGGLVLIFKLIDRKLGKKQENKPLQSDIPAINSIEKVWPGDFYKYYPMPEFPPIIQEVLNGTPKGHEDAMLMLLICTFGTFCFSKVRARYIDNKSHAPNIMVIVEGEYGVGKSNFANVFEALFSRIIDRDSKKLANSNKGGNIIQNIGGKVSESKFHDILAFNEGVHAFVICDEVIELEKCGITFELMRKAFGNETTSRNNKSKHDPQGFFRVFLNMFLMGTPSGFAKIFTKKELEGGTHSRLIWTSIPGVSRYREVPRLPKNDKLESIRDQIDCWSEQFCFKKDNKGHDKVVNETTIDLDYVCNALKTWHDDTQWFLSNEGEDKTRITLRGRISAIAFHAAIVFHMMWGEPESGNEVTRKKVIDATLYVANYCMERYLFKFGTQPTTTFQRPKQMTRGNDIENVHTDSKPNLSDVEPGDEEKYSGPFKKDAVIAMAKKYNPPEVGYKGVANAIGIAANDNVKTAVRRAFDKLEDEIKKKKEEEQEEWEQQFLMRRRR